MNRRQRRKQQKRESASRFSTFFDTMVDRGNADRTIEAWWTWTPEGVLVLDNWRVLPSPEVEGG